MKRPLFTGTLLAMAMAGYSGGALAQGGCDSEIEQLRSQNQEREVSEGARQQIRQMLDNAEQAGPRDCDQLVQQAREQMQRQTPGSSMQSQQQQPQPQTTSSTDRQTTQSQTQQTQPRQTQSQQTQPQQASSTQERATVQVQQAPANVQVDAGAPRVIVKQQPPIVTVEQQPPLVEIIQPEAEVSVNQAEPEVTVNQAEPNVEIQQAEPQVQVTQAREPEVRLIQEGEEQQSQQQRQQAQAATQSQQSFAQPGQISEREASQLVGNKALSDQQEELGEISSVVRSEAGRDLYAVVDVGGFFGIGERSVALPVDRGRVDQEGNLHLELSRDQIENLPEYDSQQYNEVQ